jgi:hypothetical protein
VEKNGFNNRRTAGLAICWLCLINMLGYQSIDCFHRQDQPSLSEVPEDAVKNRRIHGVGMESATLPHRSA